MRTNKCFAKINGEERFNFYVKLTEEEQNEIQKAVEELQKEFEELQKKEEEIFLKELEEMF